MAVLTSAAVTYTWGTSGLFWFVVPNGLAIMLLHPSPSICGKSFRAGYTITQCIKERFNTPAATAGAGGHRLYRRDVILLDALGATYRPEYDLRHSAAGRISRSRW